jgi:hypothetical protein
MAPFLAVVGILAFVGLVVWLSIFAYRKDKARIAELTNLALAKGWQFSAADPYGLAQRWPGTPFNSGYDRTARNVVTGLVEGHRMVAFDYSYKEDSTDSKGNTTTTTFHYAICALALPCSLPELHVGPEGVFSRLGHLVGMQDIELESEDFNRHFRVRCPDAKFATDVLTPRTMEMLLGYGKVHFRFAGPDVVNYEGGHLHAADLLNRAGVLSQVLAGIPAFVWKDHGGQLPEATA